MSKDLEEFTMEKMLHPPYTQKHAPSSYQSLQRHLHGLKLTSKEEVENEFVSYFRSKPKEIYTHGIKNLVDR